MEHFKGMVPGEIAFIGDRIMTDVLFANYNGFYSILVDPIDPSLESLGIKLARILEKSLI